MEEPQKDKNVISKGSGDLGVAPPGMEEDLKKMKEDPSKGAQGSETTLPCTQTEHSTAITSETTLEPLSKEDADTATSQKTGVVETGVRIVELIPKMKKEAATADVEEDPVTDYETKAVAASFAEAMKEQAVIENVIGAPISTVVMSETARREPGQYELTRGISSAIIEVGATAAVAASTQIAEEILDKTLTKVSEVTATKVRDELDGLMEASKSTGGLKNEEFPELKLSEGRTSITDAESVTVQKREVQFSTEETKDVEQETAQNEENMKGASQKSTSCENTSTYVENAIEACRKLLDICKKVSDVMPQVSSACNDIGSQYSKLSDQSGELKFKSYEFSAFSRDVIPPTESLIQLFSEETTNFVPVVSSTYEFLFTIQKMINMCLYMQNHNNLLELNYNKLYINTDKEKKNEGPQEIEISFQAIRNILDEIIKELESCGFNLDNASQTLENILSESSRLDIESGRDFSQTKTATFPRYASRDRASTSSLSSARSQRFAAARRRFVHITRAVRLLFAQK